MEWKKKVPIFEYDELHEDISDILAKIHGIEDKERFLNPTEEELGDWRKLKNIELARDRLNKAIKNNEKISIYADIDPDGIFSATTLFLYLKNLTTNVGIFHSQRSAGHGIFFGKDLIPEKTNLLVIVDSSSNDSEVCEQIKSQGIDIITIDHHQISKTNNHCILINPQQVDCKYNNKNSCGTLITWQLCRALDDLYATNDSDKYINFVAIATISDMMSMVEYENRFLVKEGLKGENIINNGLKSLFRTLNIDIENLSTNNISFGISPCLNAVCRLDQIELAFQLLLFENIFEADKIASKIVELNEQRKRQQAEFEKLIYPRINHDDKCTVIVESSIHAGYRGLIAGKICNDYMKHAILLSEVDEFLLGSYRSFDNFDLQTFLRTIPSVLYAEGHPQAGGCKIKKEKLQEFIQYLDKHLNQSNYKKELEYAMEISISELNNNFVAEVQEFYKYCGQSFEALPFRVKNICPVKKKVMGKMRNTVKLDCVSISQTYFFGVRYMNNLSPTLSIIKFHTDDEYFNDDIIGKEIEIIGELNLNRFKRFDGKILETIQVVAIDYLEVD